MFTGGERKDWYRYSDNQGSRNSWIQELFKEFRAEAKAARETCKMASPSPSRTSVHKSPEKPSPQPTKPIHGQKPGRPKVTKLMESCIVLKIEEFIIYMVSTADNKRSTPQKFFSSDKKALHLPADMSVVHMEYTDYFFTEGIDYPGMFLLLVECDGYSHLLFKFRVCRKFVFTKIILEITNTWYKKYIAWKSILRPLQNSLYKRMLRKKPKTIHW